MTNLAPVADWIQNDLVNASQNEIARLTGLSRSTVSRALSNHRHTSEETKKLVRKAAAKLGYQKNALVSMLTAQVRKSRIAPTVSTLGYITSLPADFDHGPNSKNYREYLDGVQTQSAKLGYQLDILWRRERGMTTKKFDKMLRARGIQGVIIAPRANALGHIAMDFSQVASATLGHQLPYPSISFASPWHYQNMAIALRHLLKLGFRRLGYAIDPRTDRYTDFSFSSRFGLYQSMVANANRVANLVSFRSKSLPGVSEFEAWIATHRPDVILCAGHVVPRMIEELGMNVPADISYIDLMHPSEVNDISGICERTNEVGAAAVDIVVAQLHHNEIGIPDVPKYVHIEGRWLEGKTAIVGSATGAVFR